MVPSGAASFGALVVVVGHLGAKDTVLTGILFLSHPCRGGLVMEDSVIFSITYAASSFMHKHPNGVRLTPVCAMRRARVYHNNEKEGMKISSALTCLSVSCLTKLKNSTISHQYPLYYFLGPPRPSEIHCRGDTPLSLALIPSTNSYGSHPTEL